MNRFIKIMLLILTFFLLSSCSETTIKNKEKATTTYKSEQNITNIKVTEDSNVEKNYIYEKVIFEIINQKAEMPLDDALNTQLEQSKTITEPTLDDSMKEIGSVLVQYKNSDEMVEFGKVYTGAENKMYIQAFENEHNAVLCISDGNENRSNILF